MRLPGAARCAAVAIAVLSGCASGSVTPSARTYDAAPPRALTVLHALVPEGARRPLSGIYVSLFYGNDLLGYSAANRLNRKPVCFEPGVSNVNGIAVDAKGDLLVPNGGSGYLMVFKGPNMCGKSLGMIADTYGQPADASSNDATVGPIAIANIRDDQGYENGSISVCTLHAGCNVNLTNDSMYEAGGVAMAKNGDCWVDAKPTSSGGAALIYFKGCTGSGQTATGFKSSSYGGLDIDNHGNLVVIDESALSVSIYSGCDPACSLVGGPFALKGESFFGKLDASNKNFAAVDNNEGAVDVYSYSTSGLQFEYEFDNGLQGSQSPEGIAQNPPSRQ
jgi:hypothetical protein